MRVSRTVCYALQATLQLAASKSRAPVPSNQLAAEGEMPERFLLQILRCLVAHGILDSTRGIEGGYTLGRPVEDISLLDVMEAIDGPMIPSLPAVGGLPAQARGKLERAVSAVTARERRELGAIMLTQLLPRSRRRAGARGSASPRGAGASRARKAKR